MNTESVLKTIRWSLLLLLCTCCIQADEYKGYKGHWVDVVATAYSPDDQIDEAYHNKHPAGYHRTADNTNTDKVPYGIAAPQRGPMVIPFHTRLILGWPSSDGGPFGRVLEVDDTGGVITRKSSATAHLYIDIRMKTEEDALKFGHHTMYIFIIDQDESKP